MAQEQGRKERSAAAAASTAQPPDAGMVSEPWISRGLAVKVMAQRLADYYKKKGVVVNVVDDYIAEVEMNDSGDVLRVDQAELETVRSLFVFNCKSLTHVLLAALCCPACNRLCCTDAYRQCCTSHPSLHPTKV